MSAKIVTMSNLPDIVREIEAEIINSHAVSVSISPAYSGAWGMSRLWRSWMASTAEWMAARGATMPLVVTPAGTHGSRPFDAHDAHELFTSKWLGVGADGKRLSWSRSGRDGMRPACKGERYQAMQKHEAWAAEKGLLLINPNDSEYHKLAEEENA